jgi:hypothetical protein
MNIFATLLLILETNKTPNANASFCPPGTMIQICNIGQYQLPSGSWNLYVNGTDGYLNISKVNFDGSVLGTLQLSKSSGPGLCFMAIPCNINGNFNRHLGNLSFTASPTVQTVNPILANNQNYAGFLSFQVHGPDTIMFKLDGIGTTNKPQPIKGFGWDAPKLCLVMRCIR